MDEDNALRRVLNSKAVAAANAAELGADKLELPNEQFTAPKDQIYASFWFRTGGSKQCELGANTGLEMTVGIFQFDILAPENGGDGPAISLGNALKKQFSRKEWLVDPDGYVKTLVANVKTPFQKPQNGFYRVCVDGVFHFYHSDPNAADFRS